MFGPDGGNDNEMCAAVNAAPSDSDGNRQSRYDLLFQLVERERVVAARNPHAHRFQGVRQTERQVAFFALLDLAAVRSLAGSEMHAEAMIDDLTLADRLLIVEVIGDAGGDGSPR